MDDANAKRDPACREQQAEPIAAQDLFRGQREIAIRFRGEVYRLRITRNDKLILTK